MNQAILTGISDHTIKNIVNVQFDLITDGVTKPWSDFIDTSIYGNDFQSIITSRINEYIAEIARQEVIWNAASGMFEFPDSFGGEPEMRFIAKDDYIKPLGYNWDTIRIERNKRLNDTDWTQLSDSPLSSEQKISWSNYRQSLRDLPETYSSDITSIVWPYYEEISSSSTSN